MTEAKTTKAKRYGTATCECGATFDKRAHNHKYCDPCATVRAATSVRNFPMVCEACEELHYRRTGADKFCPACHLRGFGDKRYHPGEPLDEACPVCGERDIRIADELELCASCLASADRDVARKVNKVLLEYVKRTGETKPAEQAKTEPAEQTKQAEPTETEDDRITRIDRLLRTSPSFEAARASFKASGEDHISRWIDRRYTQAWIDAGRPSEEDWTSFTDWLTATWPVEAPA